MGLGSFFKKIGKGVGKVGKFVGKSAYLGPRGIVKIAKGDIKGGLGDIAGGAARTAALVGTGGLVGLGPGLGSVGAAVGGAGGAGGVAGGGGVLQGAKNLLLSQFSKPGGGIDFGKLAEAGLSVAGLIQGAKQQGRSDDLLNAAIARDQARDLQLAPLREQTVAGLIGGGPQREDLGALFSDASNPFFQEQAPRSVPDIPVPEVIPDAPPGPIGPTSHVLPDIGVPQPRRRRGRGGRGIDDDNFRAFRREA